MDEFLTITALAKRASVSSKALRYWERLGLLPKAYRSHSGYRKFSAEALAYIGFVKRAKEMGLTLQQMRTVLRVAHTGQSPCMEVENFIEHRLSDLDKQIESLLKLRKSLLAIQQCCSEAECAGDNSRGCCSLLAGLPEERHFKKSPLIKARAAG